MVALDGEGDPRSWLSGPALALVEALLAAPLAWRSPAHLQAASGLDEAATFCGLADLEAAGLFCPWETEDELTVTLTPIAAVRLGVRLVEFGEKQLPRWSPIEKPEPPLPKAKGIFRAYEALALVADPALPPEDLAEVAELLELAGVAGQPCPACGSATINPRCGFCRATEEQVDNPPHPNRNRSRAARRGAQARQDRKARLKARFSRG